MHRTFQSHSGTGKGLWWSTDIHDWYELMVYCFKVDFFICRKCWESGINAHSEHVRSQLIYLAILATFFRGWYWQRKVQKIGINWKHYLGPGLAHVGGPPPANTPCGRLRAFQNGSARTCWDTDAARMGKAPSILQMHQTRQIQINEDACIRNWTNELASREHHEYHSLYTATRWILRSNSTFQRLCGLDLVLERWCG